MRTTNNQTIKKSKRPPNTQKVSQSIRPLQKKIQRGVTLVELTIVLVIIGIIIAVLYTQIGGSSTDRIRANSLLQHTKLVAVAADGQQQLLGCYALDARGLFNVTGEGGFAAATENNSCGTDDANGLSTPFDGPYIKGVSTPTANAIVLDDIAVGARGGIMTAPILGGTSLSLVVGNNVYYELSGLNDNVAGLVYQACARVAAAVEDLPAGATEAEPCIYVVNTDGAADDTFGYFIGRY